MTDDTRSTQLARIRDYCTRYMRSVLFDEPGQALLDVFSGRSVPLDLAELMSVEERINKETKNPYLLLAYGDGRQVALSEVGIAFPPDTRNTGALPDLPDVVCLRDYRALLDRLKHELYGHGDREPDRGVVRVLMMCIAILEGARAVRLDIGREERELQTHLQELEKRVPLDQA